MFHCIVAAITALSLSWRSCSITVKKGPAGTVNLQVFSIVVDMDICADPHVDPLITKKNGIS